MQTTISVRHGSVADSTREKIEAKVTKLGKFFDRLETAEVTIDLDDRSNPTLDIQLTTFRKKSFVVQSKAGELMTSLDDAVSKLEQQIKKYKEKLHDRRSE